jgi:CBS domain-containing protein
VTAHEFVQEATAAVKRGDKMDVTVRDLLGRWDASARGAQVVRRIQHDLRKAKLKVDPDFRLVTLDTVVHIAEDADPSPSITHEHDQQEFGLTVGNLPSAVTNVVRVSPNDTITVAYTKMRVHDFSQLPVMSGRTVKGAVTWRSIASALLRSPGATLADATVAVTQVMYSDDLLRLVPRIVEEDFVLVLDANHEVGGLVTAADLGELFADRAEPFLMLGEIDQRLRDLIRKRFTLETIATHCRRSDREPAVRSFDDLTMGDYQAILENVDCWKVIGWPLDRSEVSRVLNTVREVRNDVVHFNPDPLEPERMAMLHGLLTLLREHG